MGCAIRQVATGDIAVYVGIFGLYGMLSYLPDRCKLADVLYIKK